MNKQILSKTLSIVLAISFALSNSAIWANIARADVGIINITGVSNVSGNNFTVSGTWEPQGQNNQCWVNAQQGFKYWIIVYDDLNGNHNYDTGETLLEVRPAPCNGDYVSPVANSDPSLGGIWPASGQNNTFSLSPGSHNICAVLMHAQGQGGDIAASNCWSQSIIVPIDGGWTDWGTCSATCGGGTQTRTCTNPEPQFGGLECVGESERTCSDWPCTETCPTSCGYQGGTVPDGQGGFLTCDATTPCPIDGGWSQWDTCSATCGGGTQNRTCTNPAPQYGGADCDGDASQSCNTEACAPTCGDGTCNGDETCSTCSQDCGICPSECENVIVVSNTDDDVFDIQDNFLNKAVFAWDLNSGWTAVIDGANWIWKTYYVENPTQDETYIFEKNFDIIGVPASATLKVATDNSYKAWVNDVFIGEDTTEFNYTSAGQDQHDITNLHTGSNNIKFKVKNWAGDSDPEHNPAGLLYRLEIVRSFCEPSITHYACHDYTCVEDSEGQYTSDNCNNQCGEAPTGSITACKYYDTNKDGEYDLGTDTPLVWNITLWYYLDPAGPGEPIHSTTTDPVSGCVTFDDLLYGTYTVHEDQIGGWIQTAPKNPDTHELDMSPTIVISDTNIDPEVIFLNYATPTSGSLTICKYGDNGVIGQYEPGIDLPLAWNMRIDKLEGGTWYTGTNGDTGCVTINGLEFGSYTVSETLPFGWSQTYPSNGSGNQSQTVLLDSQNPSESVYFLNYYMTSLLPTMYSCNEDTWQCIVSETGTDLDTCTAACQAPSPTTTTTVPPGPTGAPIGGQFAPPTGVVAGAATQQGQVAGVSTACNPYLLKYIKLGADNDPEEVKKLESFLNEYLGVDLPINGIYEEADYNAVKQFQLLMKDKVLAPWVEVGCLPNIDTPTGYVYRTTEWAINNFFCPESRPDVSDETCTGGIIIGLGEEGAVLGEATTTPTTTTETTPPEETGTTAAPETEAKPSQNWLWYLIGLIVIGGGIYLVLQKKK